MEQTQKAPVFPNLPRELRQSILKELLPSHEIAHHPICVNHVPQEPPEVTARSGRSEKLTDIRKPQAASVTDLMTLSRQICDEVALMLYEEHYFVIHIHPDLDDGGIEFLHLPRQPLQYQASFYASASTLGMNSVADLRFQKFSHGDKFGFDRLKKIIIQVHQPRTKSRHTVINAYFIHLALCRLLERHSGERGDERIVSLTIEFAQPYHATEAEPAWWNGNASAPRSSQIHGISDFELVLRPFATLKCCHNVHIQVPAELAGDEDTAVFVAQLERSITSVDAQLPLIDSLDEHIERQRCALEGFVEAVRPLPAHLDRRDIGTDSDELAIIDSRATSPY